MTKANDEVCFRISPIFHYVMWDIFNLKY